MSTKLFVKVFLISKEWHEAERFGNDYIVTMDGVKKFIEEKFVTHEKIESRTLIKKRK